MGEEEGSGEGEGERGRGRMSLRDGEGVRARACVHLQVAETIVHACSQIRVEQVHPEA